ncbi:hypothetical protein C5O80_24350 [Burkholderia sp. SRS-46]|nr:hypothetical protein C5O80_24350 [Burkholderia sp. SRS-46]
MNHVPAPARDTLRAVSTRHARCAAPVRTTRPTARFSCSVAPDPHPCDHPSRAARHTAFAAADRRADATPDGMCRADAPHDAAPLTLIRHAALVERARAA